MKDKNNLTTPKQFQMFCDEFTKWQVRFELSHWRVDFIHKKIDSRAKIRTNVPEMVAVVMLDTDWEDDEVTDAKVIQSAKHEAIHLLINKLYTYGFDRNFTGVDIEQADEELTKKLEFII